MKIFGLVGKNIEYSFSSKYFSEKFENEKIEECLYKNFDIPDITYFTQIVKKNKELKGLNVTIPYKEDVIPYLDKLSEKSEKIGAINCIKITKKGKLKGYNTDAYGFKKSLLPLLKPNHKKALILGKGGASKAVAYALDKLGIEFCYVSRHPQKGDLLYSDVSKEIMNDFTIVINCTPVGTFPSIEDFPSLDYDCFSDKHIAYDLVYNPSETEFLKRAKQKGATIQNGYDMLVFQAEKGWEIWNK